jgi:hypothetical protein
MPAVSGNEEVRRRTWLLEAELDGELIGLQVDQGVCYGFNSTATRIWQLTEQPTTKAELCKVLLNEFDVDPQTCLEQVEAALDQLEGSGLIEVQRATA